MAPLTERTAAAVLRKQVAQIPDKIALRDPDRALTYRQAQESAFSIAHALARIGLQEHEPVAVMLENSVECSLTWLGISISPFVEVPVNTAFTGQMLEYVLAHSRARVLIVEDRWCPRVADIAAELPDLETVVVRGRTDVDLPLHLRTLPFDGLLATPPVPPETDPAPWDLNAIMYTSGTTGPSKGVLIPHAHAYTSAAAWPSTRPDDVVLVALPFFHSGGKWAGVYNTLIAGGTAVIEKQFSASSFWGWIDEHRCTTSLLIGGMAEFVWQQEPREDDSVHTLQRVGISPAYPRIDDFRKRFGVEVENVYGATEIGSIITAGFDESGPRNSGRARPDVEIRLVDANDVDVAPGEPGELLVRPREPWTMMLGYHHMHEETVQAWRNFWFHTGDTMAEDEHGQLCFVDRKKDVIRRRGENVSSFEVEAQVMLNPKVAQVAAVGVATEYEEEEIKIVVVRFPAAELDPEELIEDLAGRMPYFMVPRYIEFADSLPMTQTQRVRKADLRTGVGPKTWDREAAGITVTRSGLVRS